MWGSRRGIGLLRTVGIHLEGPAGSAHVAIAPGVGSAGLGIHPGTPRRPLEGFAGERVSSQVRRLVMRSGTC